MVRAACRYVCAVACDGCVLQDVHPDLGAAYSCMLFDLLLLCSRSDQHDRLQHTPWNPADSCRAVILSYSVIYSTHCCCRCCSALLQVSTVTWQAATACPTPLSRPTLSQTTPTAMSTWCSRVPGLRSTLLESFPGPPTFRLELRRCLPS
jgi:hypothetical protein